MLRVDSFALQVYSLGFVAKSFGFGVYRGYAFRTQHRPVVVGNVVIIRADLVVLVVVVPSTNYKFRWRHKVRTALDV